MDIFRDRWNTVFDSFWNDPFFNDFDIFPRIEGPSSISQSVTPGTVTTTTGGRGSALNPWSSSLRRVSPSTGPRIRMDLTETDSSFVIQAEVPGVPKEQIKVHTDGNLLTIEAERNEEKKEENERYHFTERNYGKSLRSVRLPDNADMENCKAEVKNGILALTFPKREPSSRKQISL